MTRFLSVPRTLALLLVGMLTHPTSLAIAQSAAAKAYEAARPGYFALRADEKKQRYRHHWLGVIEAFAEVARTYPSAPEAPRAVYTVATLYRDLAKVSFLADDTDAALKHFEAVAAKYPSSTLADDALWEQVEILRHRGDETKAGQRLRDLITRYPKGDMAPRAQRLARALDVEDKENHTPPSEQSPATVSAGAAAEPAVQSIKHWSHPTYSRVVIYTDSHASAEVGQLPQEAGSTPRLYVDIKNARLAPEASPVTLVNDGLLKRIRAAQHDDGRVRIVLDLQKVAEHRLLVLDKPNRIVLDALSKEAPEKIAGQSGKKKWKVVLDPGHGGNDVGALGPGKKNRLQEKDIVLSIAQQAKKQLESRGVEVLLTRKDDTYLSLEERTAIANGHNADVFISIHANSHKDSSARGIETYYLDVTHDRYTQRLADRESKTEPANDVQLILADLATKVNTKRSGELAKTLHQKVLTQARKAQPSTRDLGVKGALFYVLLGARMPAVLLETAFISNPQEAKLLASKQYQAAVAKAISDGVLEHLQGPVLTAARGP